VSGLPYCKSKYGRACHCLPPMSPSCESFAWVCLENRKWKSPFISTPLFSTLPPPAKMRGALRVLVAFAAVYVSAADVGWNIVPASWELVANGTFGASLFRSSAAGSVYEQQPLLLTLHGTRYQQGYDAGFLTGAMANHTYNSCVPLLASTRGKPLASMRFAAVTTSDSSSSVFVQTS
jgi:hypothetical protein